MKITIEMNEEDLYALVNAILKSTFTPIQGPIPPKDATANPDFDSKDHNLRHI
jgi:hypothetical protein